MITSLWFCPICGASGMIGCEEHAGTYEVTENIRAAHARRSPNCDQDPHVTASPTEWFKHVRESIITKYENEKAAATQPAQWEACLRASNRIADNIDLMGRLRREIMPTIAWAEIIAEELDIERGTNYMELYQAALKVLGFVSGSRVIAEEKGTGSHD